MNANTTNNLDLDAAHTMLTAIIQGRPYGRNEMVNRVAGLGCGKLQAFHVVCDFLAACTARGTLIVHPATFHHLFNKAGWSVERYELAYVL